MARRRDAAHKEYSPLDDARGRFPLDSMRDLVRDATAASSSAPVSQPLQPDPASPLPAAAPPAAAKLPAIEKLTQYNKFLTTPREKLELERVSARISGALGVSVRPSHLIRACLIQLLHAEKEIVARAERHETVRRPSNTEAIALAEFDHAIAEILCDGFRQAAPIAK